MDTRGALIVQRHRGHRTITVAVPSAHPSLVSAVLRLMNRRLLARRPRSKDTSFPFGLAMLVALVCGPSRGEPVAAGSAWGVSATSSYAAFIAEASRRFGLPVSWIQAVMRAESFGNPRAISPKGAIGLLQIMPQTWNRLRQRYDLGADPYDAHDNIVAGTAYLRELIDRYGIPGFLAAYNAGPGRWEDHLATGRALPAETRAYLARLTPAVGRDPKTDAVVLATVVKSWREASLFPTHSLEPINDTTSATDLTSRAPKIEQPTRSRSATKLSSEGLFVASSQWEQR